MKSLLLSLAIFILAGTTFTSFAQSSSDSPAASAKFSLAFEAGLPVGDFQDVYTVALGASFKYELPVATNTMVTLSAGYTSLQIKKHFDITNNTSDDFVPLKVGVKGYLGSGFYGEGQIGAAVYTGIGGGTSFAYSPGFGYTLNNGIDIGIRYEGWSRDGSSIAQIGFRLAYRFN